MQHLMHWIRDWRGHLVFWLGAIAVGLLSVFFAVSASKAEHWHAQWIKQHGPVAMLITPLGLMLIAWLTRRWFPGAQGSGIPQTIAALKVQENRLRRGLLSFRIAFGKIALTLLGFLSGASIGREGPTVHVGASILFAVGDRVRFPHHYLDHALILAGGAAGISAAFNTPIAGVLFAIEEMARSFNERTSGTILVAVIISGVVAMSLLGNYTYFGQTSAHLPPGWGWLIVPVLGMIGGISGGLFSRLLVAGSRWLAPLAQRHGVLLAGGCGLGVVAVAFISDSFIFGAGYEQAHAIVQEGANPGWTYPVAKWLATLFSYLSGIPGGIFAPSLSTGAGLGAAMAPWFPGVDPSAIVVLAMTAYFTGVVKTPITAAVIIMEMVNDHAMMLPIMATAIIAFGFSSLVFNEAIYQVLAQNFLPAKEEKQPGQ